MQIVQELCKRPGLNRTGFDMPTIYIPNPNKSVRCVNQIDDVCRDIEKTINQTIQNTLNQLEKDCDNIGSKVDQAIAVDNAARSHNMWSWAKGLGYGLLGALLPLMLILNFFASSFSDKFMKDLLGADGFQMLRLYLVSFGLCVIVLRRSQSLLHLYSTGALERFLGNRPFRLPFLCPADNGSLIYIPRHDGQVGIKTKANNDT